jgi:hypothetical protein
MRSATSPALRVGGNAFPQARFLRSGHVKISTS